MYIKRLFKLLHEEIYVFLIALIYRLPSLGYDFINNDAFLWKSRGYEFGSALTSFELARTAVTYHPGVPLLWSQFIAIKIYSVLVKLGVYKGLEGNSEFLVNNMIQDIVVVVLTSALIAFAYSKLKTIIGRKLAALSVLILLFEPFFIALSRTIHTDAMISLFMFVAALYFYSYIYDSENKKIITKDSVLAGVFAGLAFLAKSSALFLIPFFGLLTVIYWFKNKSAVNIYKLLAVLGFSVVSFFIFWPAMWVQPIESLNLYLFKGVQGVAIEEGHDHYWFGQTTSDPGLLFYPIAIAARYSIFLIIFGLASTYLLIKNRKNLLKDKALGLFLASFLFFLFYVLMVTLVSKKLDRYSLPIIFPLSILSAWSIARFFKRKIALVILGLHFLYLLVILISIHPNYLAYYSPLVGGLDKGRYIIEPKWLVGYDEVAKYFNNLQAVNDGRLKIAIADFDYLRPFANFEVLNIRVNEEREEAQYFVLPVYRSERNNYYLENYNLEKSNHVIKVGGVDYYYIYKVLGLNNK